ncbi:MAG: phosphate ABC transporter permease subunit PstC, partial [Hyphomicrobiales bacterium]
VNQVPQHSRDTYHGFYLALYLLIPSAILILIWVMISPNIIHSLLEQKIQNTILLEDNSQIGVLRSQVISISEGIITTDNQDIQTLVGYYNDISQLSVNLILVVSSISSLFLFFYAYRKINTRFNARTKVENIIKNTMIVASLVAILTTIGIVLSLIIETIEFFKIIKVSDFLFGLQWSPQIALREDQVANEGLFGAIPLFLGTILITIIAMCVAVPIGLLSAIYLSEYSNPRIRAIAKPMLEILAGIPTVVYGFFAALTVAPFLRDNGATLGLSLSSESALAAGIVMGIMIIPLISSLSDDVINAVPQSLREGSAALGSTQSETVKKVILPAALPGIVSAILLALSRAIGETMIVVMAAGVAANLTINPFESVTAVTVQIVVLLVGDQEFDSAKTLAAFALGFTLFIITLLLNILSIYIVRKYREQYD